MNELNLPRALPSLTDQQTDKQVSQLVLQLVSRRFMHGRPQTLLNGEVKKSVGAFLKN